MAERPAYHPKSPPAGTTESPGRRAPFRQHSLRARVAATTIAVVSGLLLAATPQASALSKHTYSTSFGTATSTPPDPYPLTNPTDVAVDQSTGDLYVANTPIKEQQTITVNATGGTFALTFKGQTTGATGTATLTAGSNEIPAPHPNGTFVVGEEISGAGIPAGTTIAKINFTSDALELSADATASATGVKLTANLPPDAPAETVESALASLSSIGRGNVEASGSNGGPYTVEFSGALGGADLPQITADASGLTGGTQAVQIAITRQGSSNADVEKFTPAGEFLLIFGKEVNKKKTEQAGEPGNPHGITEAEEGVCTKTEECQPGAKGSSPGAFVGLGGKESADEIPIPTRRLFLAVDNSPGGEGDVYVGDPGDNLVSKFDAEGNLITTWGSHGQLDGKAGVIGDFAGNPPEFGAQIFGIAVGRRGTFFVLAGLNGQLFQFAQDGSFLASEYFPQGPIVDPSGIAVDSGENLYAGLEPFIIKDSPTFEPPGQFRPSEKALIDHGSPVYEQVGPVSRSVSPEPDGLSVDPPTRGLYTTEDGAVTQFAPSCEPEEREELEEDTPCIPVETFGAANLSGPQGVAVDGKSGTVYVADTGEQRVAVFTAEPYLPEVTTSAEAKAPTEELLKGEVDPAEAGEVTACRFEYVPASEFKEGGEGWAAATTVTEECSPKPTPPYPGSAPKEVHAEASGLTYGSTYRLRLVAADATGSTTSFAETFTTLPEAPKIEAESVSEVHAETAKVNAQLDPGGGEATYHTAYHVEYLTQEQFEHEGGFSSPEVKDTPELDAGSARTPQSLTTQLHGLTPATTYHYRVVAKNADKTTTGEAHTFTTLPFIPPNDHCPNAHVQQQTGTAGLLDCRAYELVSAANAGGYDVESNLIEGQTPFGGYPGAEGRVLYGVHDGGIPGTDHPTNRGVDPYLATRTENGWSTEYVGIPANATPSSAPFASTLGEADASLDTFAFAGPEICSPCFADGSTGEPVHLPSGELIQGMAGSLDPGPTAKPDGYIAKPLSANGEHLIFGSTSQFEPDGNSGGVDPSIYDRNLKTEGTHVLSKAPGGANLPCLTNCSSDGIGELDISKDGSHVLLGQLVEEKEGAKYWHLYMNVGDSGGTTELTPGAGDGVLFDGMSADGSKVFFSSVEHLTGKDTEHSGADIYLWEEATDSLTLISKGLTEGPGAPGDTGSCEPVENSAHVHWNTVDPAEENCGVVAIGGGGGVSSANGTIYFLSPERLDGTSNKSVQNAPNLYLAGPGDGYLPHYVTTLESVLSGPQPPVLTRSFLHNFPDSFTDAAGLAVDRSSHDVYVLDDKTDTIEKFDSSGNPVKFTQGPGAGTNQLSGAGTPPHSFEEIDEQGLSIPTQLAVDNSTGSSKGDFYVSDFIHGVVDKFSPAGAYVGQIDVETPAGVAVDPADGNVYVARVFSSTESVSVFEPSSFEPEATAPTTPSSSFSAGNPTSVAVDAAGTVYVTQFLGGTEVYESGVSTSTLDSNPSQSVSVDPSNGDVAVDEGNQVSEFDSSGHPIGAAIGSGNLSGSVGVAIDPEGNLYASNAEGAKVAAFGPIGLPPGPSIDNPLVLDSVSAPATRHTADFQLSPSGEFAAFPSSLALAGHEEETAGHTEVFRYDAPTEKLDCVSCNPSGAASTSEAGLAPDGLSLTDDGRVFFNTADALSFADTDEKQDVYEWAQPGTGSCEPSSPAFDNTTGDCLALISAGTSTFDSGLLGADASGKDVYFFTRDSLAPQDKNGPTMKIYDAREEGGFPYVYPEVTCKASDECHGAASPAPGPIEAGSEAGTPNQYEPGPKAKTCKKGYVRKHGHCVKKHHKSKKRHSKRSTHKNRRAGK